MVASEVEVTTNKWIEKARALGPSIEKWRDVGEQERRLPQPMFEEILSRGFFRLVLPKAFGGEQAKLETLVSVIEEFARQDGSTAWNLMIGSLGCLFADYLPEVEARTIFESERDVAVGSFVPTGQALPVEGGYRASGRWTFGSGCQNATWITGGFFVTEDGKPRLADNGTPLVQILVFPTSDCQIIDTWRTAGMRGTGSHDFIIEDLFIPESRGFQFAEFLVGPKERPSRGYHQPFVDLVPPAMAAVSVGIARDAIDSFKDLAKSKTPRGGTNTLASQHTTHLRVGEAEALLRSARAYLFDVVRQVDAAPENPTNEQREELTAAVRLAGAHCAKSATEAVDLMFEAGGGTSIYASSRIERCFRDVHMVTHHLIVSPSNIEMVGQYLLGLGLQMRR